MAFQATRMAQTNVSSCVISIIASYTSGLDVFKKFRESRKSRKRRSKKNASVDDEELRLARSLRQGPEDIGREYQRSIQFAGDQFAHGDGRSGSLASLTVLIGHVI